MLKEKGIDVIPDVVANSGGVLVSWMEMLQNVEKNGTPWTDEVILRKLQQQLAGRLTQLYHYIQSRPGTTLREAVHDIWLQDRLNAATPRPPFTRWLLDGLRERIARLTRVIRIPDPDFTQNRRGATLPRSRILTAA